MVHKSARTALIDQFCDTADCTLSAHFTPQIDTEIHLPDWPSILSIFVAFLPRGVWLVAGDW